MLNIEHNLAKIFKKKIPRVFHSCSFVIWSFLPNARSIRKQFFPGRTLLFLLPDSCHRNERPPESLTSSLNELTWKLFRVFLGIL